MFHWMEFQFNALPLYEEFIQKDENKYTIVMIPGSVAHYEMLRRCVSGLQASFPIMLEICDMITQRPWYILAPLITDLLFFVVKNDDQISLS